MPRTTSCSTNPSAAGCTGKRASTVASDAFRGVLPARSRVKTWHSVWPPSAWAPATINVPPPASRAASTRLRSIRCQAKGRPTRRSSDSVLASAGMAASSAAGKGAAWTGRREVAPGGVVLASDKASTKVRASQAADSATGIMRVARAIVRAWTWRRREKEVMGSTWMEKKQEAGVQWRSAGSRGKRACG